MKKTPQPLFVEWVVDVLQNSLKVRGCIFYIIYDGKNMIYNMMNKNNI